jgi:hypothetical protein
METEESTLSKQLEIVRATALRFIGGIIPRRLRTPNRWNTPALGSTLWRTPQGIRNAQDLGIGGRTSRHSSPAVVGETHAVFERQS